MDKKKDILLIVFLIFLVMPFSSAFNASGDVYSIGSYHMGSAGNTPEGTDFSSRIILLLILIILIVIITKQRKKKGDKRKKGKIKKSKKKVKIYKKWVFS